MTSLALAVVLLGLGAGPTEAPGGEALVARFECNRCHEGGGLAPVTADKACVGCHAAIHAGTFEAPADALHHWQKNIVDLVAVPSLASIGRRFERRWVRDFMLQPHDLRPQLSAMMPRFAMSEAEADAIAAWLVPEARPADDATRWLSWPSRGRRVIEQRACGTCHTMTGAEPLPVGVVKSGGKELEPGALSLGILLAPDLRHVRERFQREALVAWLRDPPAQKPGTPMPNLGLSRAEAEDVAAWLLETPLAAPPSTPVPARLPVLERRVGFAEVSQRVFRRLCWHCHSEPDLALGDGGPGNTGGFGFAGRKVNLRDYESITAGGLDDQGLRKSLFRVIEGGPLAGTPKLLAHVLARQLEVAGTIVPGVRGMPLGLPPIPPEDIQLLESWIAQGRPE